ncbi:MAG: hypothetical protein CL916_11755 [Deltaproteobacteria bacterium]|nr:hypothetical protein [Deltaproteobacteria bacterium]
MSFFSRLSNLVSGFSNGILDRFEENNPQIKDAQRKQEIAKQNKDLKEAAAGLLVLEKELQAELEQASPERKEQILQKIQEYQDQRKEMLDIIGQNQKRKHTAGLQDVADLINQESAAEESLGLLRARTEVLESMVSSSTSSNKPVQKKSPSDDSTDPKDEDPAPSQKRTL